MRFQNLFAVKLFQGFSGGEEASKQCRSKVHHAQHLIYTVCAPAHLAGQQFDCISPRLCG